VIVSRFLFSRKILGAATFEFCNTIVHFADSSQTSGEAREVPDCDIGGGLFDHIIGAGKQCWRTSMPSSFAVFMLMTSSYLVRVGE
jgi:hypothetical protein